jgi:hypothetical protein
MTPTSEQHSSDRPEMGWVVDKRPMCKTPDCLSRVEPPNTPGIRGPYCPCHEPDQENE